MTTSLRIAVLVSAPMPPQEGIGTLAHGLALRLMDADHHPTLITRGRVGRVRRYEVARVPVVELPFVPLYPAHIAIHGMFVAQYLRRHQDQFDIVHAHSPLVPPVQGPWPVLTTLHSRLTESASATEVVDLRSLLIRLQTPVSAYFERRLLRASAAVTLVNPTLVDGVIAEVGREVPVRVIPNAVDVDRFLPGPGVRRDRKVVAVGRLVHGKGFEDLLAAWTIIVSLYPDARLTIAGGGPLLDRLVALAQSLGVSESVRFVGAVKSESLLGLYQQATVVVQPSHHEGLSTVILEGMACSTAVVATAVGAHPMVVQDGKNGRLVPSREPEALARAVCDLIDDPEEAARLGLRARATVVQSYSWANVARAYIELYEELLMKPKNA